MLLKLATDVRLFQRDIRRHRIGRRNVQRFRGGLVFEAHRLLYHSILGLRVINKKKIRRRESTRGRRAPTVSTINP